jgi:hypothetical protein
MTAGAGGTRLSKIQIIATATTTAGLVRLFLYDGSTYHLFAEVPVTAITPSGTVAAFAATLSEAYNPDQLPRVMPSGWSLRATTANSEAFKVIADGADL